MFNTPSRGCLDDNPETAGESVITAFLKRPETVYTAVIGPPETVYPAVSPFSTRDNPHRRAAVGEHRDRGIQQCLAQNFHCVRRIQTVIVQNFGRSSRAEIIVYHQAAP